MMYGLYTVALGAAVTIDAARRRRTRELPAAQPA